jgi:hypothetical protein
MSDTYSHKEDVIRNHNFVGKISSVFFTTRAVYAKDKSCRTRLVIPTIQRDVLLPTSSYVMPPSHNAGKSTSTPRHVTRLFVQSQRRVLSRFERDHLHIKSEFDEPFVSLLTSEQAWKLLGHRFASSKHRETYFALVWPEQPRGSV